MRYPATFLLALTFLWQCLHTGALAGIGSRQFGQEIHGLAVGGVLRDNWTLIPKISPAKNVSNAVTNTPAGSIVVSASGKTFLKLTIQGRAGRSCESGTLAGMQNDPHSEQHENNQNQHTSAASADRNTSFLSSAHRGESIVEVRLCCQRESLCALSAENMPCI